jgi:hypothetical protein
MITQEKKRGGGGGGRIISNVRIPLLFWEKSKQNANMQKNILH